MAKSIMIPVFILGIVAFTTVFFAGLHVWAQSLMGFPIFGIPAAILWARALNKTFKRDDRPARVIHSFPALWAVAEEVGDHPVEGD